MLGIKSVLSNQTGIDFYKEKVKMIRHKHGASNDLIDLFRKDRKLFYLYQSFQGRRVFDNCNYLISYIGMPGTYANFVGVFKVGERHSVEERKYNDIFQSCLTQDRELFAGSHYYYDLQEVSGLEELKGRIIIDWGSGGIAFIQNNTDKEIFEILPAGYVKEFPGFLDFTLDFDELENLIGHPESNKEWKTLLSSVAGVYLILDNRNGNQYVGSAYGQYGIWGRWATYVRTKHGGNKKLKALIKNDEDCFKKFTFTILQTLPKTLTDREVIGCEKKFKIKLGTRAFGLNC